MNFIGLIHYLDLFASHRIEQYWNENNDYQVVYNSSICIFYIINSSINSSSNNAVSFSFCIIFKKERCYKISIIYNSTIPCSLIENHNQRSIKISMLCF